MAEQPYKAVVHLVAEYYRQTRVQQLVDEWMEQSVALQLQEVWLLQLQDMLAATFKKERPVAYLHVQVLTSVARSEDD